MRSRNPLLARLRRARCALCADRQARPFPEAAKLRDRRSRSKPRVSTSAEAWTRCAGRCRKEKTARSLRARPRDARPGSETPAAWRRRQRWSAHRSGGAGARSGRSAFRTPVRRRWPEGTTPLTGAASVDETSSTSGCRGFQLQATPSGSPSHLILCSSRTVRSLRRGIRCGGRTPQANKRNDSPLLPRRDVRTTDDSKPSG